MDLDIRTADQTTLRRWDGVVLFWLVLWLVIGAWVGHNLWEVSELGDTVTSSGKAIGSTGDALQSLGRVPVVGDRTAELGGEIAATGAEVADRGQAVQAEARQLAILVGLALVLLPATPVLGFYLPQRNARRREIAEVRRLLDTGEEGLADRFLAHRALERLPVGALQRVSHDPWHDVSEGRTRALADLELGRMGLRRTQG